MVVVRPNRCENGRRPQWLARGVHTNVDATTDHSDNDDSSDSADIVFDSLYDEVMDYEKRATLELDWD